MVGDGKMPPYMSISSEVLRWKVDEWTHSICAVNNGFSYYEPSSKPLRTYSIKPPRISYRFKIIHRVIHVANLGCMPNLAVALKLN